MIIIQEDEVNVHSVLCRKYFNFICKVILQMKSNIQNIIFNNCSAYMSAMSL